jgi:uncharacterized repeat protein (TIGR03803 family)
MARLRLLPALAVIASIACGAPASAQTYTESVLYSFCTVSGCNDGGQPQAGLVQGTDGNLYGTTSNDGVNFSGTVYKLTTGGSLTTLYSFCSQPSCADGSFPFGGLIQGTDGNFYGTTGVDGASPEGSGGTVFTISSTGSLTTLYSFCNNGACPDGDAPHGNLVEGPDGSFYGITQYGGAGSMSIGDGSGTVFKIGASGGFESLYSFCSKANCADGQTPYGGLALGTDGNFYGTTQLGGANNSGTVFKITPSGKLTTIYSFCSQSDCADGEIPAGTLLLLSNGNFYGITSGGGGHSSGTLYEITPGGSLSLIYTFCSNAGCPDGASPIGALILASDGNFYGVTSAGGSPAHDGTVYRLTPSGTFSTIYEFCLGQSNCTDGITPISGVIQGKDGNLYGVTLSGGSQAEGAVYKITGLKPPLTASIAIAATPYPPSVGQPVTITATLTGSSGTPTGSVTFTSDGATLCTESLSSGKANCDVSTQSLTPGTYAVTVAYAGNSTYEASSQSVNATLDAAPTSTAFAVNPSTVTPPANVTLTATVKRNASGALGTPGGSVEFLYGSTVLATATLNSSGVASVTGSTKGFGQGSYNLTAKYKGDTTDASSASSAVTLKLN